MKFVGKSGSIDKQRSACIVAAVFEDGSLSPSAEALDKALGGIVRKMVDAGDASGKAGKSLLLPLGEAGVERLLLIGVGKAEALSERGYRQACQTMMAVLKGAAAGNALCTLSELEVSGRDLAWKATQAVEAAGNALYNFTEMRGKAAKKELEKPALKRLELWLPGKGAAAAKSAIARAAAVVEGMDMARDLANLPGNVATPSYLANQARALGRQYKSVKTSVLEEKQMEQLGMGSLLSVSRGSRQPAKLIVMEYKGAADRKQKPVVLVGKGLTFDAGGISLKPGQGMDEMKYDMCGGASVIGTIKAIAEMGLAINVVGVVPSSENLPDGAANKPGDIVTSMSGQTIEILNTDAEGRLILCDAITYSKRFNPEVVIDIATLTGACVIALGKHAAGLLGNDDTLVNELLSAGQNSGDRAWQLPLWDEYDEQLKSPFADMANIGGREAGTITAACFLSRYAKEMRWAHLDIAGTAWNSGADKGATGRPVPLLTRFLIERADAAK